MKCIECAVIIAIALTAVSAGRAAAEATYAERLGWPEGAKVVIFHVDDAGMCHDANVGTIESIEDGLATSCSIMMPCGWVPEFAEYCRKNPDTDYGIHLTLTSEWDNYRWFPVVGEKAAPGLVDEDGYFWGSVEEVSAHASPDEVEAEIRAQIAMARDMGLEPTHLDSHMGTLFFPTYFQRYMKVGIELGIPILVPGGHMQFIGQDGDHQDMAQQIRTIAKQVWDAGLPVVDDIHAGVYDWKDYKAKKSNIIEVLRTMEPGILELVLHCTRPTEVFEQISSSSDTRLSDLEAMLDPEVKKVIEEEGIILTNWRELMERRKEAK